MPTEIDLAIWRGNNAPDILWTLPDPVQAGATLVLTVSAAGRIVLERDTASTTLTLDRVAGTLRWSPTIADSRVIPAGRVARYEIEERVGAIETTLFYGAVTGLGGLNTDAGSNGGPTMLDAADPENSSLFLLGWLA